MARLPKELFKEESLEEPLLNLTPLIDVVFVVLIAFIILAPMLDIDQIQLASAPNPPSHHSIQQTAPVAITVHKDNTIWVENHAVALTDLDIWLKEKKKQYPGVTPRLLQDSRASFGTYQSIKNRVEACGFEELEIVLKP